MPQPARLAAPAWLASLVPVAALASAGFAWHECLLVVASAAAAQRLFLWRMDRGAPWEGWRAALRCLGAGVLGMAGAAALAGLLVAAASGAIALDHSRAGLSMTLLLGSAAAMVALQIDRHRRWEEARFWSVLVAAAAAALAAANAGHGVLPCIVSAGVILWLARASWLLTREVASGLLRAGQSR